MELTDISGKLDEIFENPSRNTIMKMFPLDKKQKIPYEDIKEKVKDLTSRPDYHLSLLVEYGLLIRAKGRGLYQLNEIAIQLLRIYFKKTPPICLIGGLGDLTLFTDILEAFEQISRLPKKYILFTSPEVNDNFKVLHKGKFARIITEVHEFDYQTVLRENYNKIYQELKTCFDKEIYDFEIICEITGGTKPISIALMNLGLNYSLRKSYFSGRKIIWI